MKDNNLTVCFSGHRPSKLEGGYNWNTDKNIQIIERLSQEVEKLILERDAGKFIFGGAIGIDQMAFEVVNKLKISKYPNLELVLAIPFKNQDSKWYEKSDVIRYNCQKLIANKIVYVDELKGTKYFCDIVELGLYHIKKMQIRNEYMVDHSDIVIAVWDGSIGGTKNCIDYARKLLKEIVRINPKKI